MTHLRTSSRRGLLRCLGLGLAVLSPLVGISCAVLRDANIFSKDKDVELGTQAYADMTAQETLITSGPQYEQVQRVTGRLIAATSELHPEYADFPWEAVLIDNDAVVNAWCLPGGKMAVYTGILPVTQDDTGLAVVMGHEICHATERHGTQRMTRNHGVKAVGQALAILTDKPDAAAVSDVLGQLGIGLPWGRADELEADAEGLMVMAKAGYDPQQAPVFWERMRALSGGGDPSGMDAYLSTHPSNSARIDQLNELMPQALALYDASTGGPP